jgi:hypothetical protein
VSSREIVVDLQVELFANDSLTDAETIRASYL